MQCEAVRHAMSAQMDGEAAGLDPDRVEAHVATCAECRRWRERAHLVTRRTRIGTAMPAGDAARSVMAAVHEDIRRRRVRRYWLAVARAVVCVGALQVLATVPLLVLARDRAGGSGRVHVLGLVEAAIGATFFLGAVVVLWRERDRYGLSVVRSREVAAEPASDGGRTEIGEVA